MSAMTNYLENALGNAVLRNTSYTSPATVYLSAHTADPGEAGSASEVSGNGYARVAVTFSAPTDGVFPTSADATFPAAAGGNWGTITHFAIWDASTAGNSLFKGALSASKVIDDGDTLKFVAAALTVSMQ